MPHALIETLLSLLFPDRCAGCGRLGALFCDHCQAALYTYPGQLAHLPDGLDDAEIAFLFQSPLREAIHQLKYHKQRRVARPLGVLLAGRLGSRTRRLDAVLPVPLHSQRLAERGFNQAEALAVEVARVHRLPLVTHGLVRVRVTEQQAHLDAAGRRENMRAAFAWRGPGSPPARVLLVDDVLTTGATIGACAVALRNAGACEVFALALARSL